MKNITLEECLSRDKLNPTRRFLQVRISNCLIGNYSELKLIINYRKCKNVRGNKSLVINKPGPTCTNVYFSCNRSSKRYLACILRGAWQGCVKQCARLCACIRCFLSNASEPTTDFVSYSFALPCSCNGSYISCTRGNCSCSYPRFLSSFYYVYRVE